MLSYPQSVLDAMDEGRESIRGLMRFDLGSGTYGFTNADTPFDYDGLTYQPNGLLEVSDLKSAMGTTAEKFTITLAAGGIDALTPAVLSQIFVEDYRDRPVTILDVMLDPDTNATLSVEQVKRGYIDTLEYRVDPSRGHMLVVTCEDRALDYSRRNGRQSNSEDQARRDVTDTFFDHAAAVVTQKITWGK